MKEEVDVVDAHSNVVGKAQRDDVHKKGLLHRVVQVMLFDADGRLFVQQRSASKDLFPGCLEGSLSGHVLSGESFRDAAERELHEELGVCVSPRHLKEILLFGLHEIEEERVLCNLFAIRDYKGEIKLDSEEVKSGDFWTMKKLASEMKKRPFHPLFLKALAEFKAMGERTKDFLKL